MIQLILVYHHLICYCKSLVLRILSLCNISLSLSIHRYGVVVYTGHETKFGQNKSKPILKLAVSDRMTSVFTVVVLCLQVAYTIFQ